LTFKGTFKYYLEDTYKYMYVLSKYILDINFVVIVNINNSKQDKKSFKTCSLHDLHPAYWYALNHH